MSKHIPLPTVPEENSPRRSHGESTERDNEFPQVPERDDEEVKDTRRTIVGKLNMETFKEAFIAETEKDLSE
jgi:hypothetical protein